MKRSLLHVRDDTHDPHPWAVLARAAPGDAVSDRVPAAPEHSRHGLVDETRARTTGLSCGDRYRPRLSGMPSASKYRPATQSCATTCASSFRGIGLRFDREGAAFTDAERQIRRCRDSRRARKLFDVGQQPRVKSANIRALRIALPGRLVASVNTCSALNPGSTFRRRLKLRTSRPPPMSSTTASANWTATRALKMRR